MRQAWASRIEKSSRLSPVERSEDGDDDLVATAPLALDELLLEPIALGRGQRPRVVVDPAIGRRRDAQVRRGHGGGEDEQEECCGEDARQAHGRPVSPARDAR